MKKEKAITLIALVITIIVLLILAGVSIATLTGENGILTRANEAKENTEQAEEDELRKLTQAEAATYLEEYEYTDVSGEKVTIPAKCSVSQVEGENTLEDGLVIIDANGNEFVWIEVPKSQMPEGLTFENETDYTTLETSLQTYAEDYRHDNYSDAWYSEEQHGFSSEDEYNDLKKQILKSIYENNGFFIGRYEVGSFDNPVTAEDTTRKAVIQKGAYPYNYVSCKDSQEVVEGLAVGDSKSSLMLGLQWDLVCKYLEENAEKLGNTNEERQLKIKGDSTEWGNCYNSEFPVNEKNKYAIYDVSTLILSDWKDVEKGYIKPSLGEEGKVLLLTGAEDRNSVMNIYDFAGNIFEWTLEKSNANNRSVKRGGHAYSEGNSASAASRNSTTSIISSGIGFRIVLY